MVMKTIPSALPPTEGKQPWPIQGEWTYADYLRLPDDGRRYEIIEGVLYMANAPSYDHQFAVMKIAFKMEQFVANSQLGVVLVAPFEVHLPGIAKPVQPDVLFIATQRQPSAGTQIFEGAPDLIVEVLSPSSLRLDQYNKFGAYERAGVREYWIADPKTHVVNIFTLPENSPEYAVHGQFTIGETLNSKVLGGLKIEVADLFVP